MEELIANNSNNIILRSFSVEELNQGMLEISIPKIELGRFDLFIGNNAQGKTRIFSILKFIKQLLTESRKRISTNFHAEFEFDINSDKVIYNIEITQSNEGNNYHETILKNGITLLSSNDNILFDEISNEALNNFFIPRNIPAISSVTGDRFTTIKNIREFFLRMIFVEADKSSAIAVDENASVLNSDGTNMASVLSNWKKNHLHIYNESIKDLKRCFPIIQDIKFVPGMPRIPVKANILAFNESDIKKDIQQFEWSSGIIRAFHIILLPKTPYEFDNQYFHPSLICIDEIENGLDFNTLEFLVSYLRDYENTSQIIMSSHSPLMGKFIHPKHWQIVKRNGAKIKVSKPIIVEKDLDDKLELYRQEYWDFYTNYISKSKNYEPN